MPCRIPPTGRKRGPAVRGNPRGGPALEGREVVCKQQTISGPQFYSGRALFSSDLHRSRMTQFGHIGLRALQT